MYFAQEIIEPYRNMHSKVKFHDHYYT